MAPRPFDKNVAGALLNSNPQRQSEFIKALQAVMRPGPAKYRNAAVAAISQMLAEQQSR